MNEERTLAASRRWFRRLERFYPADFRDEMGAAWADAYADRTREALRKGGAFSVAGLWLRALADSAVNGTAERLRPAAAWRRAGNWGRDLEFVTRRLSRAPLFVATTLATLTVGLGMFAVVYTATQRVLLDPMPYPNADDLYYVWRDYGPIRDLQRGAVGGLDVVELQESGGVIEEAVGLQRFLGGIFAPSEGAEPMEIAVTRATPNVFELLGTPPMLGRGFAPDEMGPEREQVMVLTHKLWRRIGADPGIVGRDVRLQGRPFTVIGVLPEDFGFVRNEAGGPAQPVDAFVPFAIRLADTDPVGRFVGLIRAREGTSPEEVATAVESVGRVIDARDFEGRGLNLYPVGLKADLTATVRPALLALAGAGLVLLLMLMVNLPSVLTARAAQREHEVAVSRALGAGGMEIARGALMEGVFLGLLGGAAGALVGYWATGVLTTFAPFELPRRDAIAMDWRIAAVVVLSGGWLGLMAAAAPAWWAARSSLSSLLAGSGVRGGGGRNRWRRGMIVAQVALSFVLLSCGALVARSLDHLIRVDPGFRTEGLFTVQLRAPPEFFPTRAEAVDFHERARRAMEAIPGVESAGAGSALPLASPTQAQVPVFIAGAPGNTGDAERDRVLTDVVAVQGGFAETMGVRLIAGKLLDRTRPEGPSEALIDDTMAKRLFVEPADALGASVPLFVETRFEQTFRVIGVVDQPRQYDLYADGRSQVYVRAEDLGARPLFHVMQTSLKPETLLPKVEAAVATVDARVPVGNARSIDEIVDQALGPQTMGAAMIGSFALGALLLAAMGLFGVVSGSVTRRRHELAVRLALGADRNGVMGLVLKEGGWLVLIGLLVGAPGVLASSGLIRGLLVGVSPADPLTVAATALLLLAVTTATCYAPARRALAIEPARLLRED